MLCTLTWKTCVPRFIRDRRVVEVSCYNITVELPVGRIVSNDTHLCSVAVCTTFPNLESIQFTLKSYGLLGHQGHALKSLETNYRETVSDTKKQTHKLCSGHLNMVIPSLIIT